jgi:replicative DNA helicase
MEHLAVASGQVANSKIWIDQEPSQTITQIASKARRMVRQHGIRLFVLDYLQLVKPPKNMENRNRELEEIVNQLVILKKTLQVPWLVLVQLNRDIEKSEVSRKPQLSDIKDCGAIEQAADQVFILYQPERGKFISQKDPETGERNSQPDARMMEENFLQEKFGHLEDSEQPKRINGFQAKNRDGATGDVQFLFYKNQFRFADWRQWALAEGFAQYGKGERRNANPEEHDDDSLPSSSR